MRNIFNCIEAYNKFRADNQNRVFTSSELKTEFEKRGLPFSYYYLPAYQRFEIVIKQAKNKYIMPKRVTYKARLENAWKMATEMHRKAS